MFNVVNSETIEELDVPVRWIGMGGRPSENIAEGLRNLVDFYRAAKDGKDLFQTEYAKAYATVSKCWGALDWQVNIRRWADLSMTKCDRAADQPLPTKLNADGRFELLDGHHRAAQIIANADPSRQPGPIRVAVKHISPTWQTLHDDLNGVTKQGHFLYQPIEHPWFDDWGCERPHAIRYQEIYAAVEEYRDQPQLSSNIHLDIGCNNGRLCREFNRYDRAAGRKGWGSYGIDTNKNILSVAERLNMIMGTDVSYFHCGLDKFLEGHQSSRFAVITCLSVVHHLLRSKDLDLYVKALNLLINCSNLLVIDHTNVQDSDALNDRVPLDPEDFAKYLTSQFDCKILRRFPDFDHRPVYLVSK